MGKLVLIRHGQSQWNLENRYTGGIDIPLTNRGREEAKTIGRTVKEFIFDVAFSSKLVRAVETLLLVFSENQAGKTPIFMPEGEEKKQWGAHYQLDPSSEIPVCRLSALNERHYGDLQGLNKEDTAQRWGVDQVQLWRRSYNQAPPGGESLKDTVERVAPVLEERIIPYLIKNLNVLLVAHGNILRAIVMTLERMPAEKVDQLEIPTGSALVYETEKKGETLLWNREGSAR